LNKIKKTKNHKQDEFPGDCGKGVKTTHRLLEMAEEVLRSHTLHSTMLATNIISMKAAIEKRAPPPILGAKAIKL
jgi:hypothetical protein